MNPTAQSRAGLHPGSAARGVMLECAMTRLGLVSLRSFLALAVLTLPATLALSHPHVFVTSKVTVLFADGRVAGLRLDWLFDDFFSSTLLEDFDGDGDGGFDAAELTRLHDNAFVALRDHGWFTHLMLDGADQPAPEPGGFIATVEGEFVRYRFELMLPAPVDPTATRVEVAVYDAEYYVEVLLDEAAPVTLENAPASCSYTIYEDSTHPYYFDMVYPQTIKLACDGP